MPTKGKESASSSDDVKPNTRASTSTTEESKLDKLMLMVRACALRPPRDNVLLCNSSCKSARAGLISCLQQAHRAGRDGSNSPSVIVLEEGSRACLEWLGLEQLRGP